MFFDDVMLRLTFHRSALCGMRCSVVYPWVIDLDKTALNWYIWLYKDHAAIMSVKQRLPPSLQSFR